MAAYVLEDATAAQTCLRWLEDWAKEQPSVPGLELDQRARGRDPPHSDHLDRRIARGDGSRPASGVGPELGRLWQRLLPAHVEYVWRHRSFGSSANNHLFGELVGLILATVRWPGLAPCAAPLDELQAAWEREVVTAVRLRRGQSGAGAPLPSLLLGALLAGTCGAQAAHRPVASGVDERLRRAAQFYVDLHGGDEPWDFGDSDDAVVTPFART